MSISGPNKLTGFINSILEFSKATEQWEIRRIFNDTLLAYTNETSDFPEGMHPWYFDSNCKDEGSPWRMLKIHRHVNLPGHFCCDDGHCIKSDLACDSVPQCKDNSDEDKTKCSLSRFFYSYFIYNENHFVSNVFSKMIKHAYPLMFNVQISFCISFSNAKEKLQKRKSCGKSNRYNT